MKIEKIFTISFLCLAVLAGCSPARRVPDGDTYDYVDEKIQYLIKPFGKSEYINIGMVDLDGRQVHLATLKSKVLFVSVSEKIFFNPENLLPYKTERTMSGLWMNEYRTEEYDQEKFTVTIKNFKRGKLVKEKKLKANGPIQNMNLLVFYLRKQQDLEIGWNFVTKIVDGFSLMELDLKLLSIDEITVPAGTFKAYHFKSTPDKFDIWIDTKSPRIPLQIIVTGSLSCTILIDKYN